MAGKSKKASKIEKEIRPPVVVVLGHVDHGKSSLLEAIREDFIITSKESGGITQHIGAYQIEHQGKKITFIDTPGHEAFSAMRQRGAKVADIAILVIDAGEGVKDQTKEAINFAKKAGIPMVVAFNKMDKPGADPEKVKPQLSALEVVVESYGGKVPSINVSAKNKQGIDELLETALLLAELEELSDDRKSPAQGTIIESTTCPKKGPIATIILRQGILKTNDIIATHSSWAKIKIITDFKGKVLKEISSGEPASILGFQSPAGVGERFKVFNSQEEAIFYAQENEKHKSAGSVVNVPEDSKVLNVVIKADVLGSMEAIEGILADLPQEKVVLRILKGGVGDINIADVKLAESGQARIFGFRTKIDEQTKLFARQKEVRVKTFDVIYELVQEVRRAMASVLSPEIKRVDLAKFKVTHLFKRTKEMQVIGGRVLEGEIIRESLVEIEREEEIIGKGKIKGLQKDKQDIGKATKGQQVGLMLNSQTIVEENDILLVYKEEREKGSL